MYPIKLEIDIVCDGCGENIPAGRSCYSFERDGDLAGKGNIFVCSKSCGYRFFGVGKGK